MRRAVSATELNLSGMTVLTEAASGAYGVTPVIAALAGAEQVYAFCRASRYGSVDEVTEWTLQLARAVDVAERITIIEEIPSGVLGRVDIVTNSGHLRPLTAALIESLPATAVIALMFEAWELRASDIDLEACKRRGIPVVGVNEQHETIDVFSYLGPLSVRQLHDCGLAVYRNKIAVACDNGFAAPIARGLGGLGAETTVFADITNIPAGDWDAVVIALQPGREPRIGRTEAMHLADVLPPEAVIVQFWGDMDQDATRECGLTTWPARPPAAGHMAVLLSEIGPEPIVRLQTGGLRAAESVRRGCPASSESFAQLVQLS
ncbi:hypothetical protein A5481_01805 [Methylobacterium platani]|uniref:Uncharacterized protein n=2 Tax=Methylobacterium platani TaxID=427683 RepID=A0A179SK11_9HYPH|nr:hypothetical protein A5481_01805 [Methylobacterium platani]